MSPVSRQIAAVALVLADAPAAVADAATGKAVEFGGLLATALQCQLIREGEGADDECSGVVLAQPEVAWRPTPRDELHVRLGFASSNLLDNRTPLLFPPWAADLEDGVQSVNGTDRDYLLTARYSHRFEWDPGRGLALSAGLIDATDYLDGNRYANDEFTQFMSAGLVNGPNVFVPSYDPGGAAELRWEHWSLNAVCMQVDGEDGLDTGFCGAQVGFHPVTALGTGNYRLALGRTGRDFENASGTHDERRESLILSFDQQLGEVLGAFARVAYQAGGAAVVARSTSTAGIDLAGAAWGRAGDNVGIGIGYVEGADLELRRGHGGEGYYRASFGAGWALSGHIQYARNDLRDAEDVAAWVFSLRLTLEL